MDTEHLTPDQAARYWTELDSHEHDKDADSHAGGEPVESDRRDDLPSAPLDSAEAASEDPYAGMSEIQRNRMIGLEQVAHQTRNQLHHALHTANQTQLANGGRPAAVAARENQQALSELRENYPEFADVLTKYLDSATAGLREQLGSGHAANISRHELERALAENVVEARHPDWKTDVQRPEFIGWMRQQPHNVQALSASERASDAIRLLDLYKAPKKQDMQRNTRLEAQASIPSGRSGVSRGKPMDEMTDAEYWAYLDRQEKKGK